MVYYRETNIISIGSILLSMTSIMTKSFVVSQGVEWKSSLFCWLCVITDFFSIFFIVSWIFLSNDFITGNFLGYFGFAGELWCIKIAISIAPIPVAIAIGWIFAGFWVALDNLLEQLRHAYLWQKITAIIGFSTFGNILFILVLSVGSIIFALIAEVFCFCYIAAFIIGYLSVDRWLYETESTSNAIKKMLDFVSNASHTNNDTIIRILCLNYGYYKPITKVSKPRNTSDPYFVKFIQQQRAAESLHQVTYKDIRENCTALQKRHVKLLETGWEWYVDEIEDCKNYIGHVTDLVSYSCIKRVKHFMVGLGGILALCVALPIYFLSRIFTIVYPYILVIYIYNNDLLFKLDIFELTMLGVYIFLQFVIFLLAFFVFRIHLWLWHILPGKALWDMGWDTINLNEFLGDAFKYYDEIQWLPFAQEIVLLRFGNDIGGIIVDYLKAMNQLRAENKFEIPLKT